jgi:hypothetical protein
MYQLAQGILRVWVPCMVSILWIPWKNCGGEGMLMLMLEMCNYNFCCLKIIIIIIIIIYVYVKKKIAP